MSKRFYKAKAAEWALGETASGKEQVAVAFNILTPDAQENRLTWYGYFSDGAVDRTLESLRICGWQGDDLTDLTGLDANEVELVVEDEEYPEGSGKWRAKVQWVNRSGGLALKAPLAGDKAKAFAASMRERIRALDAANGKRVSNGAPKQSPSMRAPEPPPLTDADNLPF
jgi:hypothetical protein